MSLPACPRDLGPGYGENSRVLKWVVRRLDGTADAVATPIGNLPTPDALDTTGLNLPADDLTAALHVDIDERHLEIPQIVGWFAKFGDKLPAALWTELDALKARHNTQ